MHYLCCTVYRIEQAQHVWRYSSRCRNIPLAIATARAKSCLLLHMSEIARARIVVQQKRPMTIYALNVTRRGRSIAIQDRSFDDCTARSYARSTTLSSIPTSTRIGSRTVHTRLYRSQQCCITIAPRLSEIYTWIYTHQYTECLDSIESRPSTHFFPFFFFHKRALQTLRVIVYDDSSYN